MSNLLKALADLLFPPKCPFCHKILGQGEAGYCGDCQRTLPWIEGECSLQSPEFVTLAASVLWYRGGVRDSVHRYKFSGMSSYAPIYGTLVAQCANDHLAGKYDLISWVPLSAKSLKKRGYDQAKLLAEAAAQELGTGAVPTLEKVHATAAQSTLKDPSERRANVMGVYEIVAGADVEGRRILLVDDVITTGSTLSECARILRTAGAAEVCCVTLARAGGGQKHTNF
ncbi:MAG: ComF family protein [Oscillospiraceae bacterium]